MTICNHSISVIYLGKVREKEIAYIEGNVEGIGSRVGYTIL